MTSILDQLLVDHRNIEKVLSVLEQEMAKYDTENTRDADTPDLPLILDILDYMHAYPEFFHHPIEEAAFDVLLENGLGDRSRIDVIRGDHTQIYKEGDTLREQVNSMVLGNPVSLETLHQSLNDFAWHQREHIRREEADVFGAFKALTPAMEAEIRSRVTEKQDPLFVETSQGQYRALLDRLG